MARKTHVVRITLDDYRAPVTQNLAVGLHNVTTVTDEIVSIGETSFFVIDASLFQEDTQAKLTDGVNTDYLSIESVDYDNNVITVKTGPVVEYAAGSTINSNSCFMLAMDSIAGHTDWVAGLIATDGIDNITRAMRKVGTGFIGATTSSGVTLTNTGKIWNTIKSGGYSITGSLYEVLQYDYTTDAFTVLWSGYCEQPEWDAKQYRIEAKSINREAVINQSPNSVFIGENIPAKLEPIVTTTDFDLRSMPCIISLTSKGVTNKQYPLYLYQDQYPTIDIIIGTYSVFDAGGSYAKYIASMAMMKDCYVTCVSGTGSGTSRPIDDTDFSTQMIRNIGGFTVLRLNLLSGFGAGGVDNTSHFLIQKIETQYQTKTNGAELIYGTCRSKDGELPKDVIKNSSNIFKINNEYLFGDSKVYNAIKPLRVEIPYPTIAEESVFDGLYLDATNSIYRQTDASTNISNVIYTGNLNNTIDRNGSTSYKVTLKATNTYELARANGIMLKIWYDNRLLKQSGIDICIGVKYRVKASNTISLTAKSVIKTQAVYVNQSSSPISYYRNDIVNNTSYNLNTVDKEYYTSTENSFFSDVTALIKLSGEKDLNRVDYARVYFGLEYSQSLYDRDVLIEYEIYDVCFIVGNDFSNTDDIFCKLNGRKFNTTDWSRTITSTDTIRRPTDIIEHCNLLANWHDTNDMPVEGFGYGYSPNAKIAISGDGSFANNSVQTYAEAMKLSGQITGEQTTEDIKERVCLETGLISYASADRYERILQAYDDSSATDNIGISDMVNISDVEIIEQPTSAIYCEPIVRYNFDPITGKYLNSLSVIGTAAETYATTYVNGDIIGATEKETLWNQCKQLYKKVRVINKPPTDLTDLKFANDPETMETVALNYLRNWIRSMFAKEISFQCHSDKVIAWEPGHLFNITLPHQTNGAAFRCILKEVKIELSGNYIADVRAIVTDEIPANPDVYDTNDAGAEVWQDTNTATGDNEIHDIN